MKKRLASLVLLLFFTLIATLIQWSVSGKAFDQDRLVVWVFDVGQGDAIFIDGPDTQVLIDGGPSNIILEKLSSVMPFWDRSVDLVVNTHPHADHVTGLNYVLERYSVHDVWASGQEYGTEAFIYFESIADPRVVYKGQEFDLGSGAKLTVIWPEMSLDEVWLDDVNDGSIAMLLEYGDTVMFFPGDLGIAQEKQILDRLPDIDVLKVAHQGSLTSSSFEFLQATTPEAAIIPVGENDYGHPDPIIVERLHSIGAQVLRTDLNGDIRVSSDGGEPWVNIFDL